AARRGRRRRSGHDVPAPGGAPAPAQRARAGLRSRRRVRRPRSDAPHYAVPPDAALEQRYLLLFHGSVLALAQPLLADAEVASQLLQRARIVAQPPLLNDRLFAVGQLGERLGQPDRARAAVAREHHGLFGRGPVVGEEILPLVLAGRADRG